MYTMLQMFLNASSLHHQKSRLLLYQRDGARYSPYKLFIAPSKQKVLEAAFLMNNRIDIFLVFNQKLFIVFCDDPYRN